MRVRILVTAGNTQTPIDRVRCLTNIFSGRTGARIALGAHRRGHSVCLLISQPGVVSDLAPGHSPPPGTWTVRPYQTYDDLHGLMAEAVQNGQFDAVIHAAAVSDYRLGGVFAPGPGTSFDPAARVWSRTGGPPQLDDVAAGKVRSSHGELWLRLVPAPKLVDMVRRRWGFRGVLVKFKLEVGVSDRELLEVAEQARRYSGADLMVANTLDGMAEWAFVGRGEYERVSRKELTGVLLAAVEGLFDRCMTDSDSASASPSPA
jgi:phosphopantothenate-cysteine ligase/phosphopantothenoylcysteine decarboxylase/phosphopantothenate--cysteine ligase